jgi:hypothetical protein
MTILPAIYLAAALAQTPAPASPNQVKKGTVSGTVVNGVTKEPLKRAEVTLMPMRMAQGGGQIMGLAGAGGAMGPMGPTGSRRVQTDNEGKFTFADVDSGRFSLIGQKTGFLNGRFGARGTGGAGTQIEVSGDQAVGNIKIELTPQAVISGRVLDEDGEPMQGQSVQVLRPQVQRTGGGRRMMGMGQQMTNDRGEFRIPNVAPGTVYLQVNPGRGGFGDFGGRPPLETPTNQPDKAEMGYAPTFYPGTTDPAQATKIDVTPGSDMSGFEFRLQKVRVFRVKGKIIDEATGQPPRNFFVNLQPQAAGFFGIVAQQFNRGGNEGIFELRGVPPGSYQLNVQGGGGPGGAGGGPGMNVGPGGPNRVGHSEPVEVGGQNVEGLVIRLPVPVKVIGQVSRNTESKDLDISSVRVTLTSSMQGFGVRPIQIREDGTFETDMISPGKYHAMLIAPGDLMWLESVKYGEQDVLGQEFEITSSPGALRFVVSSDGGAISGTVLTNEGQPAPSASVILIPQDKNRRAMQNGVRTAQVDQNSAFSFKNLAPGKYQVYAVDQYEYGFWDDDETMRLLEGKGVTTEVDRKGSQAISVKMTTMP